MRRPTLLTLLAALVVAGPGLTGCSDDDEPANSPTDSAPSVAAPSDETSSAAPASAYLEVPETVELTEPGSELAIGEPAVAAWTPRQDLVGVVEVAVTAVESARPKRDLAGYEVADARPYFVRAQVENVGDTDLGGRRLPLYAVEPDGSLVEPSGIDRTFRPCPGSTLPAVFGPGETTRTCLVFLVPTSGGRLDGVMFRPPEGVSPLTWEGAVNAYQPPEPREKTKKKGKPQR